ncbi:MAG: hypothetical protein J6U56_03915 [Spirochaetia bacterium]|nr:hypothetical protein [Spirochaetia bacterium]
MVLMSSTVKDIIAIGILVGLLSTIFVWKLKMANRKVKCNNCGKVVLKDEWSHFKHCPECKCEEFTPIGKQK